MKLSRLHHLIAIVALSFPLMGAPTAAQAAVRDGTIISQQTLAPLAAWVERATGTKITTMPTVIASARTLKLTLGLQGVRQARALAAYTPGRVVINNLIWYEDSAISQSYIVHELVHHAQWLSGKRYACGDAKEFEAYTLQNQWLAEQGEDPIVTVDFIQRISSCDQRGA